MQWRDANGTVRTGVNGTGVNVMSAESFDGQELTSPDLAPCFGAGFVMNGPVVQQDDRSGGYWDYPGHGAMVAAAVCGSGVASSGEIRGIAIGARVAYGLLIVPSEPIPGYDGTLAEEEWALYNRTHPRVFTSSVGTPSGQTPADHYAPLAAGVDMLVTWAAGNDGGDGSAATTWDKEGDERILLVGALTYTGDAVASYSSRGAKSDSSTWPDIMAPSCFWYPSPRSTAPLIQLYTEALFTVSSTPDCPEVAVQELVERTAAGYYLGSGTSQAAPVVAAVAALMYQVNPWLTSSAASFILTRTADAFLPTNDTDGDGRITAEEFYREHGWEAGFGRVNATLAVAASNYMAINPGASPQEAVACSFTGRDSAGTLWLNGPELVPCTVASDSALRQGESAPRQDSATNDGSAAIGKPTASPGEPSGTNPSNHNAGEGVGIPATPVALLLLALIAGAFAHRRQARQRTVGGPPDI